MAIICPNCHKNFGSSVLALRYHLEKNPSCRREAKYHKMTRELLAKPVSELPHKRKQDKVKPRVASRRCLYLLSASHEWVETDAFQAPDGTKAVVCKRCGLTGVTYEGRIICDQRRRKLIENCNNKNTNGEAARYA